MSKWLGPLLALLLATFGLAAPVSAQGIARVKCESWNYQPAQCPVGNIVDVRVSQVIGGSCRQGPDWRFDRRAIFVANGCRAFFDVRVDNYGPGPGGPGPGYPGGGYPGGQIVRCESQDYRPARCPADTRGGVQISRVLGSSPCRQGATWGWDRGGIWVNNGCRADFLVNAGGPGPGYPGGGYPGGAVVIECSSRNYQPARCNTNVRTGVVIERVLGGECIQGRTWGWDRAGIWVNNGCRGRFRVY